MKTENLLQNADYDPNAFCDWLQSKFDLKNDAQLSRYLEVAPPVLSKLRHKRMPIGDSMLVRVSDLTGLGTKDIKRQMFSGTVMP